VRQRFVVRPSTLFPTMQCDAANPSLGLELEQTRFCSGPAGPCECRYNVWSDWSICPVPCGGGGLPGDRGEGDGSSTDNIAKQRRFRPSVPDPRNPSSGGEQLYVFTGTTQEPNFLYALNYNGAGWTRGNVTASATSHKTEYSGLPRPLWPEISSSGSASPTIYAVNLAHKDAYAYQGEFEVGTKQQLLEAFRNPDNWASLPARPRPSRPNSVPTDEPFSVIDGATPGLATSQETSSTTVGIGPGAVALLSFSSEELGELSFVALSQLSPGVQIHITDHAWTNTASTPSSVSYPQYLPDGHFGSEGGILTYTVPSDGLSPGEIVHFDPKDPSWRETETGFKLSRGCPLQSEWRACNVRPCPFTCDAFEWGAWSACTRSCLGPNGEIGERARQRFITRPSGDGKACPEVQESVQCNAVACPVDCTVSEWQPWTSCSANCGPGRRSRYRTIMQEALYGGTCNLDLTQEEPCMVAVCDTYCELTGWMDVTACTGFCANANFPHFKVVQRVVTKQGIVCPTTTFKTISCELPKCGNDCKLSLPNITDRTGNSHIPECSVACQADQGVRTWVLSIAEPALISSGQVEESAPEYEAKMPHFGRCLPDRSLIVEIPCSGEQDCTGSFPTYTDCVVSEWGEWGQCSHQCGLNDPLYPTVSMGYQIRSRMIITAPYNSTMGKKCGPLTETRMCSNSDGGDDSAEAATSEEQNTWASLNYSWAYAVASAGGSMDGFCGRSCSVTDWSAWSSCPTAKESLLFQDDKELEGAEFGCVVSGIGHDAQRTRSRSIMSVDTCITDATEVGFPITSQGEETVASEMVSPCVQCSFYDGKLEETAACNLPVCGTPCQLSDWKTVDNCSAEEESQQCESEEQDTSSESSRRVPRVRLIIKPSDYSRAAAIECDEALSTTEACEDLQPVNTTSEYETAEICMSSSCVMSPWGEWGKPYIVVENKRHFCVPPETDQAGNVGSITLGAIGWQERWRYKITDRDPETPDGVGISCNDPGNRTVSVPCDEFRDPEDSEDECSNRVLTLDNGTEMEQRRWQVLPCEGVVDCEVGEWSSYGQCSSECNGGFQARTRSIIVHPRTATYVPDGSLPKDIFPKPCAPLSYTRTCNNEPCACMEEDSSTSCRVTQWSPWSTCTAACGGGNNIRVALSIIPAACGGAACTGGDQDGISTAVSLVERQDCGFAPCHSPHCAYTWGSWSECDLDSCLQHRGEVIVRQGDASMGGLVCVVTSRTSSFINNKQSAQRSSYFSWGVFGNRFAYDLQWQHRRCLIDACNQNPTPAPSPSPSPNHIWVPASPIIVLAGPNPKYLSADRVDLIWKDPGAECIAQPLDTAQVEGEINSVGDEKVPTTLLSIVQRWVAEANPPYWHAVPDTEMSEAGGMGQGIPSIIRGAVATYRVLYNCTYTVDLGEGFSSGEISLHARPMARTVVVKDWQCPICTGASAMENESLNTLVVEASFPYTDSFLPPDPDHLGEGRCTDALDGPVQHTVAGTELSGSIRKVVGWTKNGIRVNVESTGTYRLTYMIVDRHGNWNYGFGSAENWPPYLNPEHQAICEGGRGYIRTVVVRDTLQPVISLQTSAVVSSLGNRRLHEEAAALTLIRGAFVPRTNSVLGPAVVITIVGILLLGVYIYKQIFAGSRISFPMSARWHWNIKKMRKARDHVDESL